MRIASVRINGILWMEMKNQNGSVVNEQTELWAYTVPAIFPMHFADECPRFRIDCVHMCQSIAGRRWNSDTKLDPIEIHTWHSFDWCLLALFPHQPSMSQGILLLSISPAINIISKCERNSKKNCDISVCQTWLTIFKFPCIPSVPPKLCNMHQM